MTNVPVMRRRISSAVARATSSWRRAVAPLCVRRDQLLAEAWARGPREGDTGGGGPPLSAGDMPSSKFAPVRRGRASNLRDPFIPHPSGSRRPYLIKQASAHPVTLDSSPAVHRPRAESMCCRPINQLEGKGHC
jgi:hypothetical protein